MSERVPSIGIDFGTTNSSMAWYNPRTRSAEIILNAEGEAKTPSLVYFGEDETLVGKPVDDMIEDVSEDPARRAEVFQRTVMSIKRNLIAPPRIALPGGRFVCPEEVAAEILKRLKRDAEDGHFHREVSKAVITCPAEFNALQRQRIEEAGRRAGFSEVLLLEEPVAGALAYSQVGLDVGRNVLVYDLGGGTFDLAVLETVLENEEEPFYVALDPKGIDRCGGDDFDLALYYHCDELARKELNRPISSTGTVDLKFLRLCRRRKENLTHQKRSTFSDYLSSEEDTVRFEHEIDRETFEGLIDPFIETTRLTEEIINEASDRGHEVDTVVLIGGSSKVPLVLQVLKETLPVSPLGFDRKEVAVALGAAYYANIRWGPTIKPPDDDLGKYREAVEMVWADGKLNYLEAEWLRAFASELGMDQDQAASVEREVMGAPKEALSEHQDLKPGTPGETGDFALNFTFFEHSDEVHSVAFTLDGGFITSGGSDHEVKVWNVRTGQFFGTFSGHSGRVSSLTFDPNGKFFASGSFDKAIKVWKLPEPELLHDLDHSDWVWSLATSPDGRLLASGGADKEIKLWSPETGKLLRALTGHSHWVLSVAISPDGRRLVSGGADKEAMVWDLNTGELLNNFEHPGWVWSVAISPDGNLAASGSEDGAVRVWDLRNGGLVRVVGGHAGPAYCVAISPDGQLLFSGGADRRIKVWNLKTGELLNILSGHSKAVGAVAVSPDGQLLASGGYDRVVAIWRKEGIEEPGSPHTRPDSMPDGPGPRQQDIER